LGLAINSGTVVGFATTRTNVSRLYFHERRQNAGPEQAHPRIDGFAGSRGINDAGQIAGSGTIHGQTHAFFSPRFSTAPDDPDNPGSPRFAMDK
jgi:hypothetical protein